MVFQESQKNAFGVCSLLQNFSLYEKDIQCTCQQTENEGNKNTGEEIIKLRRENQHTCQ